MQQIHGTFTVPHHPIPILNIGTQIQIKPKNALACTPYTEIRGYDPHVHVLRHTYHIYEDDLRFRCSY